MVGLGKGVPNQTWRGPAHSASHIIRSVLNVLDPNDPNRDGYFRLTCFFENDPRGTARGNKKNGLGSYGRKEARLGLARRSGSLSARENGTSPRKKKYR